MIDALVTLGAYQRIYAAIRALDPHVWPVASIGIPNEKGNGFLTIFCGGRKWVEVKIVGFDVADAMDRAERQMAVVTKYWDRPESERRNTDYLHEFMACVEGAF
jgi:hypothetical protein